MRRARCVARLYRLHDHFFVTERGHTHTNSTVGRQHTHARHDVNLQELGLQRLLPTLFNKNLSQRHTLYNHMNAPARCEDPLIAQSHERMRLLQSSVFRIVQNARGAHHRFVIRSRGVKQQAIPCETRRDSTNNPTYKRKKLSDDPVSTFASYFLRCPRRSSVSETGSAYCSASR